MSDDEAFRLFMLIAADRGVVFKLIPGVPAWQRVTWFASKHLPEDRTLRFLRELEQRRLDGRPLIRPEKVTQP